MLKTIINFMCFHPEIAIVGAITLIQIAPIKIDPWSKIMSIIKKLLIGDLEGKIDKISGKVEDLDNQVQEDRALRARTHILRFADELYNKERHSKEYFDEILYDIDKYEKYCDEHPKFINSKTGMSSDLIKETYNKLIKEHSFL